MTTILIVSAFKKKNIINIFVKIVYNLIIVDFVRKLLIKKKKITLTETVQKCLNLDIVLIQIFHANFMLLPYDSDKISCFKILLNTIPNKYSTKF